MSEAVERIRSELLTEAELATALGVKPVTVRKYLANGSIPQPVRLGGKRFWRVRDVLELLGLGKSEGGE